jgi:DNA-binding SARP family transcriptional activator
MLAATTIRSSVTGKVGSQPAPAATRREAAIIRRKLAPPPLPRPRVERPRLARLLGALLERHRIVFVSATAGAGKTTAVVSALHDRMSDVAWLTVDRTDAAPGRLLAYLEAALALRLPHVAGVATEAMAAGLPHAEAAGLLAEAVGDEHVVLVLDDLERLADADDAWHVIEGFLRYAPEDVRAVLISRQDVTTRLAELGLIAPHAAAVGEADLGFTRMEAAQALAQLGLGDVDPSGVVAATGGWVTGVLFEAWRSERHIAGAGGEADPLHGYLSAHILGRLRPEDREFLVLTSVLDEVSAPRAEALGLAGAGERLVTLRAARLPVVWRSDGLAMRCHPRFREYLLECLDRRGEDEVRQLRRAHGRLLANEGHDEEATEELLRAGAREEAVATAERAIFPVIERLDLAVAERWLAALADVGREGTSQLTVAELMIAIGTGDCRRALRICDDLEARGERERLARASDLAAVQMAVCYGQLCRLGEAHAVLDAAAPSAAIDVMHYAFATMEAGPPPPRPEPTGAPTDAFIFATDYFTGRLSQLAQEGASRWIELVSGARRIGALRALGRTEQALELYEAARALGGVEVGLDAPVGPEVLIDAGREDEARDAVARGRSRARANGSIVFEAFADIAEAKLELRLRRDAAAAREALDHAERLPGAAAMAQLAELIATWYGYALLLQSDDAAALERLRAAVAGMRMGRRRLELPTAAVYLAEAEWRAGHEDEADRAADVALAAARELGSNHVLLQALADFPAVLARRIDAEPAADSPWHELGRALAAQGNAVGIRVLATVLLREFGRCEILVNGEPVRPRIAKTYELLAYLAASRDRAVERSRLLDALFDGRDDDSTRAYLRQAIRWLRKVLPEEIALVVHRGVIAVDDAGELTSDSARFEADLAEAARLVGEERLAATLRALEVYGTGDYLPCGRSSWVDDRRVLLADLATQARHDAAELAFAAGRYHDAQRLIGEVLETDQLRETAWRLGMRIASALGDEDRVIRTYSQCERALAEIGAAPAPATRELLARLRR